VRVGGFESRFVWVWARGGAGAEEGCPGAEGWGVGGGGVGEEGDLYVLVGTG